MLAIDLSEQVESVFVNTLIRGRLAELGGVDASGEAFANAWGFDCLLGLTSINSSCGTSINANKFMSHFGVLVPVVTCVFLVLRSCNDH